MTNFKLLLLTGLACCVTCKLPAQNFTFTPGDAIKDIAGRMDVTGKTGTFVTINAQQAFYEKYFDMGEMPMKRYTACFRNKSCWMTPSIGTSAAKLPSETQFILMETAADAFLMAIPLVDNVVRSSLSGSANNHLVLVAETGDTATLGKSFTGLYLLKGSDPYTMITKATEDLAARLGSFTLRKHKQVPWIADHFGWCTYNALYGNLNADTLRYAMNNLRQKNIPVQYILMDVGWQNAKDRKLTGYGADPAKFPEGLQPVIQNLKNEFGIQKFLVWQTLWGFWQGVDKEAFPELARSVSFVPPPRMSWMLQNNKQFTSQEATVGPNYYPGFLGQPMHIPRFMEYYNQSFDYLRRQGVDGVKIDAITWIEAVANNHGGRLKLMNELMTGLQSAASMQFNNELINCSSCSNDYFFNTISSNLTRSSGDFFPDKPASHGFHIYTNAHTSFWMGDMVLPDWDMFQSGHLSGAFHAAARAISGGPVYSTEEIGTEDTAVLRQLMTSEGVLPRCKQPGKICRASLFTNPATDKQAIKIFNLNTAGGVVGAFNCSYDSLTNVVVTGTVSPADIDGLEGSEFIMYRYADKSITKGGRQTTLPVALGQLGFDLVTVVPVVNGFAPIGVVSKYNPGGMITKVSSITGNMLQIDLLDGGPFVAYAARKPKNVLLDGKSIPFAYAIGSGTLSCQLPIAGRQSVVIVF